jgi:hypothetical protein
MFKALFAAGLLAGTLGAPGATAQTAGIQTVTFGCDAPAGSVCYFAVYMQDNAVLSFSLAAGGRRPVYGAVPARDRYQVAINHPTPGDFAKCQSQIGGWCKVSWVGMGYNN